MLTHARIYTRLISHCAFDNSAMLLYVNFNLQTGRPRAVGKRAGKVAGLGQQVATGIRTEIVIGKENLLTLELELEGRVLLRIGSVKRRERGI